MKKLLSVLVCLLLSMIVFLPLGVALSAIFGYQFTLGNAFVFLIITVVLAAVLVALSLINKEVVENKIVQIIFAVTTPCALISTVFYMTACGGKCLLPCLLLCAGCCYLTIRQGQPQVIRVGALVLTASLLLPVGLFCAMMLAVNAAKVDTVVQTVASPNGTYYANVINSDQGEMGGNTFVKVYESRELDAVVFKISKKPQLVYTGEKGEFENMELAWNGEDSLLINSVEYKIN
ncbi:MAG: hypothetical protein IJX37_03700 [Oscillospiraceae bacterium]|nr:hypothetical protein [Oscillospiraceae bacterium]